MAKAKIVFVPVSGDTTAAWGVTNERGHYRLLHKSGIPGVSIGEYKVAISPLLDPEMLLRMRRDSESSDGAQESHPVKSNDRHPYRNSDTTPLRRTVKEGSPKIDFKLERAP